MFDFAFFYSLTLMCKVKNVLCECFKCPISQKDLEKLSLSGSDKLTDAEEQTKDKRLSALTLQSGCQQTNVEEESTMK